MRLCLHLDINKTIMVADVGAGRDVEASLNSLLSEATFGTFPRALSKAERRPEMWQPVPDSQPGVFPLSGDCASFGAYLEDHTLVTKSERRALKCSFTKSALGSQFCPALAALKSCLTFTAHGSRHSAASVTSALQLPYLRDGLYQLLPSFFALVNELVRRRLDFRLLFRTFGVDTANVAAEFNLFCEGRHPLFEPIVLLDGSHPEFPRDLRLRLPGSCAALRRTSGGAEGVHLAYVNQHNLPSILTGSQRVKGLVMDSWLEWSSPSSQARFSVGLVDDYSWWEANDERDDAGKLLLVDAELVKQTKHAVKSGGKVRLGEEDVVHVFLDDNIERDRAHIVDVRCQATFAPLSFETTQNTVLFKVEPFQAITDANYFVDLVSRIADRFIA